MSTATTGDTKAEEVKEVREVRVWGLPLRGVSVASGDGFGAKSFTVEELDSAVRNGLATEDHPIRAVGIGLAKYPRPFRNIERFEFPNNRDGKGPLREAVLVRFPKGAPFSHRIVLKENPERVIYRLEADGAAYLGTVTYAGALEEHGWGGAFLIAKTN